MIASAPTAKHAPVTGMRRNEAAQLVEVARPGRLAATEPAPRNSSALNTA